MRVYFLRRACMARACVRVRLVWTLAKSCNGIRHRTPPALARRQDTFIFKVEGTGVRPAAHIVLDALNMLSTRCVLLLLFLSSMFRPCVLV